MPPIRRRPLRRATMVGSGGSALGMDRERGAGANRIDALGKLKGLLDSGVLTAEQYESERGRLTEREEPMDAKHLTKLGPVQLLLIAFEDARFDSRILAELRRLREHDVVRLIDLAFVAKDGDGDVYELEQSDISPEESAEFGALVGALVGFDAPAGDGSPLGEEVWFLADAIPPGSAAAIVLLEHRWASPLRAAIEGAGGHTLDDVWVHPRDLTAIGAG